MAAAYCISTIFENGQLLAEQDVNQVEDEDEPEGEPNASSGPEHLGGYILRKRQEVYGFYHEKRHQIKWIFLGLLTSLYLCYFSYAMYKFEGEGSWRLLIMTAIVVGSSGLQLFLRYKGAFIYSCLKAIRDRLKGRQKQMSWSVVSLIWLTVVIIVIYDMVAVTRDVYNLVSFAGILVLILLSLVFSKSRAKVDWLLVLWGLGLQFVFALIILRLPLGFHSFSWIGIRVTEFLSHIETATVMVFGGEYDPRLGGYPDTGQYHLIMFKLLPVIVLTSSIVSVLYYMGVMQFLIIKCAAIMQVTMGTTAAESLSAVGNIFLGMTEAPLMIRPLIEDMTCSELHALMAGGYATIAGAVLGVYVSFGAPANHLLSASVMSAPAALAISKIMYPELEKTKATKQHVQNMEKSPAYNISHALYMGASSCVTLLASIAANLVAILALLHLVDSTLGWLGARVGWMEPHHKLSLQLICSYVLWPIALVMGVEVADCRQVAQLVGTKTFLNEFIAYQELAILLKNKALFEEHQLLNGTWTEEGIDIVLYGNDTIRLYGGVLSSDRSLVISTYALCGFSNFGSIGVLLGSLTPMAPWRKRDLASVALTSMVAGNIACFLTACVAVLRLAIQ